MGSWFSSSKPNEENSVKLLKKNTNRSNGPQSNNSEIFKQIKNIYMQRHAVSCANTIEKVFGKGQKEKSLYAKNSKISYVGVQQCLQVSDYFSKNPIESGNLAINNSGTSVNLATINNSGTSGNTGTTAAINNSGTSGNRKQLKPLLIFCCSELIRTQQTLFLSWIRYLKDYKERKGKIIVIPWLNEVSAPKVGSWIPNKDNYPASFQETKEDWIKFIQNLRKNIKNIKADTLNPNSTLVDYIDAIKDNEVWDQLFYLSPLIYKENATNRLSNNSKKIQIRRKGIIKKMGDMDQFIGVFSKILQTYIDDPKQDINMAEYNGIELVIVAHHNSAEYFMEFVMPSTHAQFKEIQLVNCEVVKLPGQCLQNFVTKIPTQEQMIRVFPINFNNIKNNAGQNSGLTMLIAGKKVYPLFILYISELDLFMSVNNIVKTRLKGEGTNKRVQIKKPLILFLLSSISDYRKQLEEIQKYIQRIEADYSGKPGSTFYNYAEMLARIDEKREKISQYLIFKKREDRKQPQIQLRMGNSFFNSTPIQQYIENNTKQDNTISEKNRNKTTFTLAVIHKKLKRYLFDFCELEPEIVNSIAVF